MNLNRGFKRQGVTEVGLTPEKIISRLFSFHNKAHFYHLQTTTLGHHLLLDELYKSLVGHKDSIGEYLLGIQAPNRFSNIIMEPVDPYSDENLMNMINDGISFSVKLCEYGESNGLEELVNLASDLQGSFVKAKLFMTYK